MASVVIAGDTSGSITLAAPAIAGSNTLTLPTLTATVAVNGPAFSAYVSTSQIIGASTWTKIAFATEEFDTANCFDNVTNFRFTPNVAGYYQVNSQIQPSDFYTGIAVAIYKNGSIFKYGNYALNTNVGGSVVSALIYLNGTTDYIECYAAFAGTAQPVAGGSNGFSYFQAYLARTV
jgi:hypothetical protein